MLSLGDVLIFTACCGVPLCCQNHYEHLGKVIREREKNSVATVVRFCLCFWVYVGICE